MKNDTDTQRSFMLIADDNVEERFRAGMLLRELGYNSFAVSRADHALEIMNTIPPTAVFADAGEIGMAILSGIKRDRNLTDIPLILLSTTPNGMLEGRARRGVIAGLLRKPVDAEKLSLAVESPIVKGTRWSSRRAVSLTAEVAGADGVTEGLVTVLSESGMFFRTLAPHPIHARLNVYMTIEGRPVTMEAEVVFLCSRDEGPFGEPGMGIKFLKAGTQDQAVIKAFIMEGIDTKATDKVA